MKFKVCLLDQSLEEPAFMFFYEVNSWPLPENKKEYWASNSLNDLRSEIEERMRRFRAPGPHLISMFFFG